MTLSTRALADLLLLALFWGASFLAIRTALDEIGPLTTVALRVAPAAALLWAWAGLRGHALPPRAAWSALAVMGLLNNAIPFTLMAWGQLFIPTGLTAILNVTTAIWGALVAALVFSDERLSPARAAAILLGFAGVVLAVGPEALAGAGSDLWASGAVLLGTFSYALAGAWARATLAQVPPVVAAAGMLTGASLIMVPLALAAEGVPPVPSGSTVLAILYYAGVATGIAYLLYFRILAQAGSANLLLVTLLIPPVAIVLGALVRGEALPPSAFAGLAALAVALLILRVRPPRRVRPKGV
ncbi:DMT family transporter [Litorisediminicola beolgyonensis]|uniref:DMT family transporter n=1 Tax=Litorisediminicola beolgyonensis TaxID=1173614 RepID=A0ABW3ZEH3_9RHOB